MKFFFTYVVEVILVVFLITQILVPGILWSLGKTNHYSKFLWFFRDKKEKKTEPGPPDEEEEQERHYKEE